MAVCCNTVSGNRHKQILGPHWPGSTAQTVSFWFGEPPCLKGSRQRAKEEDT